MGPMGELRWLGSCSRYTNAQAGAGESNGWAPACEGENGASKPHHGTQAHEGTISVPHSLTPSLLDVLPQPVSRLPSHHCRKYHPQWGWPHSLRGPALRILPQERRAGTSAPEDHNSGAGVPIKVSGMWGSFWGQQRGGDHVPKSKH